MPVGSVLQVLVATQAKAVYEALRSREDAQYEIAMDTGTIKDLLPTAQLIIIDYEDIIEYPFSSDELRQVIFEREIEQCSSADFLAGPDNFLDSLIMGDRGKGGIRVLPRNYCVCFLSYSGGTGRTTLALDTAFHFAATMKAYRERRKLEIRAQTQAEMSLKPACAVELTYGISSFLSLTGLDMPSLYQLATQADASATAFRDVMLLPMDYENVRMLSVDLVKRYVEQQIREHRLTVVDCIWPHGLAAALTEYVNAWVVVASDRQDTIENARRLQAELRQEYPRGRKWLVLNQAPKGANVKVAGEGEDWDLVLPRVGRADDYRGDLGRAILAKVLAPVWTNEYDRPKSGRTR